MTNSLIRVFSSIIEKKNSLNHTFTLVVAWACDIVCSQFLDSNSTDFKRHSNTTISYVSAKF